MSEAYCVKCKSKKWMSNANETTSKNGRKMIKGNCSTCDTKMNKFIKGGDDVATKNPKTKKERKPRTKKSVEVAAV